MAYVNQERKKLIAEGLKKVMPTGWKYTLRVRHHSTLVLTIRQADVDLIGKNLTAGREIPTPCYRSLNEHHLSTEYDGKLLKIFEDIKNAMMVGNHDNSDVQTDYFNVGWYIDIHIGEYRSPFRCNNISTPRPAGMPEGLDKAGEMAWMKNRISQLEGRA